MFRRIRATFFVTFMLLLSRELPNAYAQTGVALAEVHGKASEMFQRVFEKVDARTLPNGLRVVMYPRGEAPVFAGVVAVRVGGSDETVGETGISHMFEHMAFKGTPEIGTRNYAKEKELLEELETLAPRESEGLLSEPERARWEEIHLALRELWVSDQFTREFDTRGAEGMNATTDSELTKYFVNLPRSAFEFWLKMESDRILTPVMRQFYQERDVVMEERHMRYDDDPEGKLYELLRAGAFLAHSYKNPVIGYPFDIRRLTASALERFHKRYYVPGNIVVAIVGDVRPETDWPLVEQYFGRIPAGVTPSRPAAVEPAQQGERRLWLNMKASPMFYAAYHKPNYPHPDDAPISIMLEMLAGSSISPMQKSLVQRTRVASIVGATEGPGVAYPNLIMFFVQTRAPHHNHESLAGFDRVLAEFTADGITQERLQIAKRAVAVSYFGELASNSQLGLNLASATLLFSDWRAPYEWYEKAMAVTVEDVARVARTYLVPHNRTVVFLESGQGASEDRVN